MATDILLPKIGFSTAEATIIEWLAADGATIQQGAPLFVLESEKSTVEIEAPASGVLRIIKAADEVLPVGTLIGEIS